MALRTVLAQFCPQPDGLEDGTSILLHPNELCYNLCLIPRIGDAIPCHEELLRARCPCLPTSSPDGVLEVDADPPTIFVLLRWVYCEALDLRGFPNQNLGSAVIGLAQLWGLRDITALHERLVGSWRTGRRAGTLVVDLVRAYDSDAWGTNFGFHIIDTSKHGDGDRDAGMVLPGGWPLLLRARSRYFEAMLGGKWVESNGDYDKLGTLKIHWPKAQLAMLLRFLHGQPFVGGVGDLQPAVECGSFFGVPSLLADANDWIATNLQLANASTLWDFVDKEPRLCLDASDGQLDAADAHDACLDFHLKHFAELAQDPDEGDGSWVPLHDLSYKLMRCLLSTGLIPMPREALMEVVKRFVFAKCGGKHGKEYAKCLDGLRPPAVLFNRELREILVGTINPSIRTIL